MYSEARHEYGTAIAVVTRVVDVLQIQRNVNTARHASGVVELDDFLEPVVQRAVSEEKAFSAELQISAVISRYRIEDRCDSNPVVFPVPSLACNIAADSGVPVHLGVCERFVAAVVPAEPSIDARVRRQGLFGVETESIFQPPLHTMGLDVGHRIAPRKKTIDGFAIASHIGVVHIGEETQSRWLFIEDDRADVQLDV